MRLHVYGGGGGRLALHALMGVMMVMIVFLACSGLPVTGAMGAAGGPIINSNTWDACRDRCHGRSVAQ